MALSALWLGVGLGLPGLAAAEPSRWLTLEGLPAWLEGDASGCAIGEDAELGLPARAERRWADPGISFTAMARFGDSVVVAPAGGASLMWLHSKGELRPLADLPGKVVTSLAAADGGVWAATAEPAGLFWVSAHGQVRPAAPPPANFVWAMALGAKGQLYLACGQPGVLAQVDPGRPAKVLFDSEQAHLRALAVAPDGALVVGGGERGVIWQLDPGAPPRALADTGHAEITALLAGHNAVVAAAVTGAGRVLTSDGKGPAKEGEVRSQLVHIAADGSTEALAGSSDEAVLALAWDAAGQVLAATGATLGRAPHGRIYRVDPVARALSMWLETPSQRITHLTPGTAGSLWLAAASGGELRQMAAQPARTGTFVSAPLDAGLVARFGVARVVASLPGRSQICVSARTGQLAQPDFSWSPWSPPRRADERGVPITVPSGRFVQLRFTLHADGADTPQLREAHISLRRQNLPPQIRQVMALRPGVALHALPREERQGKMVMLAEPSRDDGRGELGQGPSAPPRARQVPERGALAVRWVADDPNGDDLIYSLWVRQAQAKDFRLLADKLDQPFHTLSHGQLAEGRYIFRVVACDHPSNVDKEAACHHLDSRAVIVDSTAPVFGGVKVEVTGRQAVLRARVHDRLSPLRALSYALDLAAPRPLLPVDGVLDGPAEHIALELADLDVGPHQVVLQVVDEADNEARIAVPFVVHGSSAPGAD